MACSTQAQTVYNTALDVNNLDFVNLGTYFSLDNEAGAARDGLARDWMRPTGRSSRFHRFLRPTLRRKIAMRPTALGLQYRGC